MKQLLTLLSLVLCVHANAQKQIWKAIRASVGEFSSARDGQKCAWLRNEGVAYSAGGWFSNATVFNEVYKSNDKGITWTQVADAPWPETNDFRMASSVTGDTLVKWGGDNGEVDNKRIDIYTSTGGWQHIGSWGEEINNGHLLTGSRHKNYYYMLGNNGKLSRFTLEDPTPQVIHTFTGDTAVMSGFMISLPNGRLIFGGGQTVNLDIPGKVWYSDDDGFNWELLLQDDIFKTYWCEAIVLKTAVIYWAGRDDIANVKGVYYIPIENLMSGLDTDKWEILEYLPAPRHAQGVCAVLDANGQPTDEAIGVTGNFYNSSWFFKRIDSVNTSMVLPVTGLTFNARQRTGNTVELRWRTFSEHNNKGFEVQRSFDGRSFSVIGFVPAVTQGESGNYQFIDHAPQVGKNYYRLRQIDNNEAYHYSMIRWVDLADPNLIKLYPNPAKDVLNIYTSTELRKATLRIRNIHGQLMKEEIINGSGTFPISIDRLPRGTYSAEIISVEKQFRAMFIKQ